MNYLSDLIAWGSERGDINTKLYEELAQKTLAEIIKLYDEATDGEIIKDRKMHTHIIAILADKLELPMRDIIVPFIANLTGDLNNRLDELEKKFMTHRHDASKAYTEKPSW